MNEPVSRIEPARLEEVPSSLADIVADLSAASAVLGSALHPNTAANLAGLVRIMNTYYSNLIEGHDTRPRDIERALAGHFDENNKQRNLQLEAAAHVRVQTEIDRLHAEGKLPEPASCEFILWLHREFYKDSPDEFLLIKSEQAEFLMEPGAWRSESKHDVAVGRHIPPSSERVMDFMHHFESRFEFAKMSGKASRILAIPAAHHRFNYIHPFPDGNGRVSRLMSHAMALKAEIGAHGLWSVSRGLARGLSSRSEYKSMLDHADMPRQGDLDGRGNLSQRALIDFSNWFLKVCLDQITFMSSLFGLEQLDRRLENYVHRAELRPESINLLKEALVRGQFERGDSMRITGLPERSARRVLNELLNEGLLASSSPKTPVSLRFPISALEVLFPKLYPET